MSETMTEYEPGLTAEPTGFADWMDGPVDEPGDATVDPDLAEECEARDTSDADSYAEWIVRKYAEAERAINVAERALGERVAELNAEMRRVVARTDERTLPLRHNLAWLHNRFDAVLLTYAKAKVTGKTRSVKLLYGTLAFRKAPDALSITDEDAAIGWTMANLPSAIKMSVAKTPIKDYIKATGETPDGCELVIGGETFTIKTEEDK